jgi:hypothetical protein
MNAGQVTNSIFAFYLDDDDTGVLTLGGTNSAHHSTAIQWYIDLNHFLKMKTEYRYLLYMFYIWFYGKKALGHLSHTQTHIEKSP